MTPRRAFLDSPEAWTRAGRQLSNRRDCAAFERDPRRSGGQWLDWVLLAVLAGVATAYVYEFATR